MSGWQEAIDEALRGHDGGPGEVTVHGPGGAVGSIDLVRANDLGVRARAVRVRHAAPRDVADEADRVARDLRDLPHRLAPVEVDRGLGGAVLRSRPEELRRRELYEVRVTPEQNEVRRLRIEEAGRAEVELELGREQLARVLEGLGDP